MFKIIDVTVQTAIPIDRNSKQRVVASSRSTEINRELGFTDRQGPVDCPVDRKTCTRYAPPCQSLGRPDRSTAMTLLSAVDRRPDRSTGAGQKSK